MLEFIRICFYTVEKETSQLDVFKGANKKL